MEDRALRGRNSHRAFVTQPTAVAINTGTLFGSKYNLGHPYRVDLGVSALPVLSKCIIVFY